MLVPAGRGDRTAWTRIGDEMDWQQAICLAERLPDQRHPGSARDLGEKPFKVGAESMREFLVDLEGRPGTVAVDLDACA